MRREATTEDSVSAPQKISSLTAKDITTTSPYGVSDVPVTSWSADGSSTSTNKIVRTAGATYFIQHYDRAVTVFNLKRKSTPVKTKNPERRLDSVKRSARRVKELSLSNYPIKPDSWGMPCFLSTTYKDKKRAQPENRAQQIADANAFIRKLRKAYGNKLKFVGVRELQDGHRLTREDIKAGKKPRMTIQYHWLVFNMPYNEWEDLKRMWGLGTVHINRLKFNHTSARNASARVSNYITKTAKYMSKEFGATATAGENTYFPSIGLEQPQTFFRWEQVDLLMSYLQESGYVCTSSSPEPKYNPYFDAWCVYEEWNPPDT